MKAYLRSCFPVLAINGSTAMRNAVVFLLMLFFQYVSSYEVMAQATLDNGNANAAALMARIQGNGVTLSNGSFPNPGDATAQYGTFSNGISGASLSVDEGIILATGSVATALSVNDRANSSETTNNTYNDPDLTAINSTAIYDAAIFQFDITTGDDVDAIIISYQFGSEEYPDYVCSRFNDAFGFFVTGPGITGTQNIARVPESNNVVAVNSVNGGVCGSAADGTAADLTKSNYFIDNNEGTPGPIYVEFNGLTTLLNGKIEGLSPNTTYTFKIALADVGDGSFDSGVIINQVVGFKSNNDNDGLDDSADLDDDNDGIDDTVESFGNEPNGDEDGDGLENWRDVLDNNGSLGDGSTTDYTDADNNGFPDVYDSDGDEIPNHLDPDSDNDGCNDVIEAGFNDPDNDGVLGTSPVTSDANGRVTGEGGYSGTNSFVTTFNQQGALTAGPTAQSINEDQNVTFSVTATGDNLVYQWQENQGSGWANVTNGGTTPAYSGATSASLTLTGVPFAYNGYDYRLILTSTSNACTDTTSGAVNLEVINGPSEIPVITSEFCNASSENVTSVTGTTTEATTGLTIRIYTADTETGTKTQVTPSGVSFSGTTWTASGLSIAPGKWIFATAENVDELEPESDFSTGVQVITKTPDPGSTLQITSDPAEGDATLDGSVVSSTVNDLVIQLYVDGVAISGATTTVPQAGSPATVSWQITGLNTPTDKLYEGGVATVTMTYADAAYCESDPSPGVVIDCKPDVLIALGTVTDPNQCNTNTGSIQLTGLSGNTTYSVSYDDDGAGVLSNFTSNASGELVLNGLNAGTYTNIQVQTACPSNIIAGPITLSDPPTPAITFNNSNNPSNCGGSDGSIVIDGLSGSTSYTVDYKVDGVAVQRTISASGGQLTINNLSAGSYTDISVTLQGCQSNVLTGPYNLDDPFAPNISYNNDEQDPSSCSATDGYIRLRGLLAFQAYNYQYTKSGTVVNSASPVTASLTGVIEISNLEAGTYRNISVTPDGSTCQSNTIDQIVLNPPDISISASSNPTTCAGTEGSITLTGMASNTTYALNYKVDGVAATQTNITTDASGNYTISGLTEGSYAELNLSIGGCTTNNLSTTLTGPSPVTVAVEAINHPTTCGGSDGSVLVNGLAPSTTYTVNGTFNGNPVSLQQASDGNGKLSFTNLAAGSYTNFSVTKDNCQSNVIASVVLNDPDAPSITLVDTDVTVCQGTTSVGLSYSATTESPNRYYIDFDAAAEAQGFVDVDTTNLPVSPITLTVPVGAAAGSYNALLSVYNSSTNCGSAGTAITVNVSAYPAVPQINAQITNDQTPVISGTADANNDVEVQVGGATYNITANGSGNWSVDTETATPDAGAFNPNVNGVNEVVAIASNAAGCSTSDTSTNELTIDSTLPTVDIKNEPIRVNTTDPYNVTFSFSEAVTNFTLTDITVGNGTASNFVTVNDSTYTADITPNGTGDITIDVAAGVAQDAAGNDNTAATQAVTEYDVTAPTVDIQNEPAFVNSTSAYNVTIAFSEDVSGFTITDLNVGNGTASNFVTVDGSTYTVDITPDGTGDITIDVAAGVAQDAAGNDNTAATQAVTQYDDQAPTPVITGAPAYVTSNTPYDITVDFGEEVSGFVLSDLLVSNGTGSNLVDNTDGTYTITITPDGSGDLTYDINAGVATDAAGNSNNAATQVTTIYDASAPTVDIQDEPAIVNSTSPYTVTFSFNEDVTGFTLADIAVVNGAAGNFVTVNDSTYTADITPNGTGDITIDVAAGVAQDAAGNDNTAATQAVTEYDVTAPTVDIQNEPAFVNSTSAYNVTIAFSEDVSGFTITDLNVGNGTASNFVTVDGSTYTVDITPDGTGDITIDVAAGVAQDAAGNDNTAATQAVTQYDDQAPTPVITGAPAYVTSNTPYDITVDFGEVVSGFVLSDLLVSNGTGSNLVDNTDGTYTITITPDGSGDLTYDINAGVATDAAGNSNNAATQVTTIYDASAPTVDIQDEPAIVNSTSPYTVTFSFNEDVTGFTLADIAVVNGAAGNFVTVNDSTYTADITPNGTGDITIDVAAGVAQDAAGNDNTAATQAVTEYDVTAPTVDIQNEPAFVNSTSAYNVTIAFSEDVSGFTITDLNVGNGTASNFVTVDGSTYTVDITPDGTGDITIDVAAGVAQDAAGNDNTAATQAVTQYDDQAPTPVITGAPAYVTSNTPYDITVDFGEVVSGFVLSDLLVSNGTGSNLVDNTDGTYTITITPDGSGDLTYDINAGVATDAAGNSNNAATQVTTIYDASAPTVDIQDEPAIVNSTSPYTVTFSFNEDVTGFTLADIAVVNGAAGNFVTVNDSTYTADITPNGTGDITIDVAAGVAQDAAGNDNTAATQAVTEYDVTAPTVDIQNEPAFVNSTSAYNVTIAFSEDVSGFTITDLNVGNGTASNFVTVDGSTYTVDITPDGTGDITIDVAAGVAQDAAGNDNTAATQAVTQYDDQAPTPVITGAPAYVTSNTPYDITVDFGEVVSGFVLSDLLVSNGTGSNLVDNTDGTYTITITPDGSGDITYDINAGVATDAAGNSNNAATQVTTIYDASAPTVDIQDEPAIVNSTSPYTVTFSFNEDVTGFTLADIAVVNGAAGNFVTVNDSTYTADITPNGTGDITIDVAAGVAQDAAGNDNTAATQAVTEYDVTTPTVDIQNEPAFVNSTSAYNVTIAFSEDVSGFTITDLNVGNGTASNFVTVDGSTYTVDITPDGTGDITIDVAAGVAQDAAGNDNTAATQAVTQYDDQAPTPVITGAPAYVTSNTPYDITVDFGEVVSGFVLSDLLVSNGTGSNLVDNTDGTYTITITPDGSGDLTYDINAGVATDAAGNSNNAATQVTTIYDASAPTVDIQDEPAIVNSTSPYTVTFSFNEDVTGFTLADIAVVNGAAGNFVTVNDSTYTADITPNGTGDITIDVAAGVAQDAAGNDNTAATQAVTEYDVTAPTVDIQNEPAFVNSTSAYNVTIAFSEDVSGFTITDLNVGNGTASNFVTVDGSTYTVDITPDGTGDITIDVAAGVAQDAAGNDNTAATQAVTQYDDQAPTPVITGAPAYVTSNTPYDITVDFGEVVSGFVLSDLLVSNGTGSNLVDNTDGTYTITITPDGSGDITYDINAGVATDAAGNSNNAATQVTTIYDASAPTVDIQDEPAIVNSTSPYTVTFSFNEDVTGFTLADIAVVNGAAGNFVTVNDSTYTADITPNGTGDITIDVAAGVAQDAAGNDNTAATQAVTEYDVTAPTPVISGAPTIVNSTTPYVVTIDFGEEVSGFVAGDITVGNGAVTSFTDNGDGTFSVEITPSGAGDITLDVAAGVAQDAAGNSNNAATQVTTTYDDDAPVLSIENAPDYVNSTTPYTVTFQFSEDVSGFDVSDIGVTNGSASNFIVVDANTYTADITPSGAGNIVVNVPTSAAQDAAGNGSTADSATTIYDTSAPTPAITGAPTVVNNTDPYTVTIDFQEAVTGFVLGDVSVTNGSASGLVDNGDGTFDVTITPSGAGDISIDVAAGVAQDLAGNDNLAATTVTTTYDTDAPTVDIQGEPAIVNSVATYTVTIQFSEDVTGFDISDILVGNGSKGNFQTTNASTYTVDITPDGTGDITIDVPAASAQDASTNDNAAAIQAVTKYDATSPTVAILNAPDSVNSTNPYQVTIQFDEKVSGLLESEVSVTNGAVSNLVKTNDSTYTADITPDGTGDISIDIAGGAAQDEAGNDNTVATTVTTVYDITQPDVTISNQPDTVNSTASYVVNFQFTENVSGFSIADIDVGNGTASNFVKTDGQNYSATITPSGAGDITIDVAAGVAQDAAGNTNTAATQVETIYDADRPTARIENAPAVVGNASPYDVEIHFNEAINGFTIGDITVTNGGVTALTQVNDSTYTAEITPNGAGDISVAVAENVATDNAGNDNTAATTVTTILDEDAPTVDIQDEPAYVNNTAAYTVTFSFNEDVTGFALSDINVGNGTAANLTTVNDSTYTAEITPDGAGDITINVAGGVAQDAAGNGNTAATTATTIYDNTSPAPVINNAPDSVNTTDPFTVVIDFGEVVSGFVAGEVTIGNGSVTDFVNNGDGTYNVTITPSGAGDITIDVAAGVAQDAAGNTNTAATQVETIYDADRPTARIENAPAVVGNASPYDVEIHFNEAINGFTIGDITVTNGGVTALTQVNDSTYTAEITPNGAGDISVAVAENVATDNAGNGNTAATTVTTILDEDAPTVDIQDEPAYVNNTAAYTVTFSFNEDVTGFALSDINVGNGTAANLTTVNDSTYTAEITPDGAGDITINVAGGVAQDAAGNGNTAATTATTIYDNTAPAPVINNAPDSVNTTDPFTVVIDFGEVVSGFVAGEVTVGNGSVTDFVNNGDGTYNVTITPSGAGDITIDVAAGVAQDAAGNSNTAATQVETIYDADRPTARIENAPAVVGNTTPYDVEIHFNEAINGFTIGDITVTNGGVTALTQVNDSTYTAEITPNGAGDISVAVAENVATDNAGNGNTAATTVTTILDEDAPTVDIQDEPAYVNNTAAYTVTFSFNEDVTGFALSDINVGNGTAANLTTVNDSTYTAEITPDGTGDITINVAGGVAQDAAGNDNTAATTATTIYDNTAPAPVINNAPDSVNTTDPFTVVIDFGEVVSGFVAGEVTVGNGSVTDFVNNGDGTYNVTITPSGAGDITIDVAAGVAQDAAGNTNTAATQVETIYDADRPTARIENAPAVVGNTTPYDVEIHFNEAINGFTIGDITVTNGGVTALTQVNDSTYTAEITPNGAGDISVAVAENVATDNAGNGNTAATTVTTILDEDAPTVDIQDEPAYVNNTAAYTVTFSFNEDVTGFALSDINVGNGTAANLTTVNDSTYTAEITPDGTGDITINVAGGVAQDAAGNGNTAATTATTIYDNTAPAPVINNAPDSVNTTDPFTVVIDFGEVVSGFVAGEVTVGNGSVTDFVNNGDGTYNVTITPSGAGDITIDVAAGVAQDAAGNSNTAATQVETIYDADRPTARIENAPAVVGNASPYDVEIHFNEAINGFTIGDITVTNGGVTALTQVNDSTYTAEITPNGAGDISVAVAENVATDNAGNGNTAATTVTTILDEDAPTVDIQDEPAYVNNTAAYTVTIDFGETVTGFDLSEILVGNGSAANLVDLGSGEYTVEITPDGTGDISININAAVAQDNAGNDNIAASEVVTVYDNQSPSVEIQNAPAAVNATTPYTVVVAFDEVVSGFVASEVSVGNGSVTNFTNNGDGTYDVEITPSGAGDITIDVAAGVAQDAAGNLNTAATTVTTTYDITGPTVAITGQPTGVNSMSPYEVTVDFGEQVTGFTNSDLNITNGSVTSFVDNGDGTFTVEVTPDGNGDIVVEVPAGAAQDAVGNDNSSASVTTIYDTTPPTVAIENAPDTVNTTTAYVVDIQFSEGVENFVLADISVTNGFANNFIAVDADSYQVSINPDGNGDIAIAIAAAVAKDSAGNDNTAATTVTTVYDVTSPAPVVTGMPKTVSDNTPFSITVDFEELVYGFEAGDIVVGNGTVSGFVDNGDGTYTVEITPDETGDITVDIPAGVAADGVGNANVAATTKTTLFDDKSPEVVVEDAPEVVNNNDLYTVTLSFNEAVFDVELSDVRVVNGTASNLVNLNDSTFTVDITPNGAGDISVDVPRGTVVDTAGNPNIASEVVTTLLDTDNPGVEILNAPTIVNDNTSYTVTLAFDEPVTGVELSDVVVANGSASTLTVVNDSTYTVEITPDGNGDITIDYGTGEAIDAAGNSNDAASTVTTRFDDQSPTVTIENAPAQVNTTATYTVTIQFSDSVSGFELSDLSIGNGTASNFVQVDGDTYTVDITPDGNGNITVDVAANVANDEAGNGNEMANTATTVYDITPPDAPTVAALNTNDTTPVLTGAAEPGSTVVVTLNGVEFTTTADASGNWSVDSENDTPTAGGPFTALTEGDYDIQVTSTDAAGNTSSDATTDELTIDTTAPGVPTVTSQVTDDNSPVLTGTADANTQVDVLVNGVTFTTTADASGNWTINTEVDTPTSGGPFVALADGTYDVQVTSTDQAGNTTTDATADELVVDTQAPAVPTVTPSNTADTTPVVEGTAEAGSTVVITINGVTFTTTADASGNWSIDTETDTPTSGGPFTPLSDGTFDVAVTSTDAAGNTASDTSTDELEIDATAPAVPSVDAQNTNDTTPVLTGTAEAGSTVTVELNGVTFSTTADASGNWSIDTETATPDSGTFTPLTTGTYDVSVTSTDAAGNSSSDATVDELVIDTANPSVPTITAITTNDTTPILGGTADAGTTVSVVINGVTFTTTADASGNWSINTETLTPTSGGPFSPLADGTYEVQVTSSNDTGNSTADTTSNELVVDTEVPAVPTVESQTTTDNTPVIQGTAEAGTEVRVSIDGVVFTTTADASGNWTIDTETATPTSGGPFTGFADGTYNVIVSSTDGAGNSSTDNSTGELVIDASAPSVPTVTVQETNDGTPVLSGTADAGTTVTVVINGVTFTTTANSEGVWQVDTENDTPTSGGPFDSLTDGTYDVAVTSTDDLGNATTDNTSDELVINSSAPSSPTVNAQVTEDATPVLSGTADAGTTVTVTVAGVTFTTTADASGNWTIDTETDTPTSGGPFNPLDDDTYEVVVVSTDDLGNSSSDASTKELVVFVGTNDSDGDGVADKDEDLNGDNNPNNDDTDGDGAPNYLDADDDGDGVPTSEEDVDGDGNPANDDTDGDGTPNYLDSDDDGDGMSSADEDRNGDGDATNDDTDGDGTPDYLDTDDDGDGVPTSEEDVDGDGNPANDDTDGDGTPNYLDTDDDGDGIPSTDEDTNGDGDLTNDDCDGDGTPNYLDADACASDSDSDGVSDTAEDVDRDGDPANDDTDGDGTPDYLDSDDDGDGVPTSEEDVDGDGNPANDDTDGDGTPDYLDSDDDGDGIPSTDEDTNGDGDLTNDDCDMDGTPNYLDADPCTVDSDSDGVSDDEEDIDGDGNPANDDTDGDGNPDYLDLDDDGDGIPTSEEDVDGDGDPTNDDTDGDGIPNYLDADDDGDGIPSADEDANGDGDLTNDDCDMDGTPNYLDADDCSLVDSDDDGVTDYQEDRDGDGDPANDDTDGDGTPDYLDDDDDGDGVKTIDEDSNMDGDYTNDDCDQDGTPNYLDADECADVTPRKGFTPDGDGVNDFFYIENIEQYPNNNVQIFNRWGNKVFEIEGYDNQSKVWSSESNVGLILGQREVPSGTYFYLIDLGDGSKPISGFIVVNK